MTLPFHTVGHSTRTIDELVQLLRAAQVDWVVDIRTIPRSRTNPQFNEDTLPGALRPFRIGYERIAELGGLRGKIPQVAAEVNGFWENRSFHNYADYALTPAFRAGLGRLVELGRVHRCAMMCSEAVWWRCHRRLVADYLIAGGESVFHLMGNKRVEPARLTEAARLMPDGVLNYPAGP